MKKLAIFTVSCMLSIVASAQQKSLDNAARGELQFGVVGYDFYNQYMPSMQIGIVAPAGKYVSLIPFVNVYTTLNSTTIKAGSFKEYTYRTLGVRGGLNFRVSTNSQKSHAYTELQGSFGYVHQSGRYASDLTDKAFEYLGGLNIGGNFKMPSGNFLGIYVGTALGYLNNNNIGHNEEVIRYHAGITYQAGF